MALEVRLPSGGGAVCLCSWIDDGTDVALDIRLPSGGGAALSTEFRFWTLISALGPLTAAACIVGDMGRAAEAAVGELGWASPARDTGDCAAFPLSEDVVAGEAFDVVAARVEAVRAGVAAGAPGANPAFAGSSGIVAVVVVRAASAAAWRAGTAVPPVAGIVLKEPLPTREEPVF